MPIPLSVPSILPLWPITANLEGLSQFDRANVQRFVDLVNASIPKLNEVIALYHQETNSEEKLRLLKQLHHDVLRMHSKVPNEAVSRSMDYVFHIQQVLFYEIQQEFKALGFPSMQVDALRESRREVSHPESPAEIIANMSPEKISKLTEILTSSEVLDKDKLKVLLDALYQHGEVGKEAFDAFRTKYTISALAGVNSKNFMLTRRGTSPKEQCVLKLEDRLGRSSHLEAHLRESGLQDVLTPISADRQVTYRSTVDNKVVTRRVVVTDFYKKGALINHPQNDDDDEESLDKALDIYTQMAEILKRIEAAGCAFPDMKNSNWLMDGKGHLRISDTKTFLPVHANGTLDTSGGLPLSTGYIEPPEICFFSVSSTKMHSYMYAKNLYQYLTRCTCDDFYIDPHNQHRGTKEVADLNFNLPVFKTDRGKLLEPLIKEMMQTNPAARPSLEVACARLKSISAPPVRQTSALFNEVEGLKQEMEKIKALGMGEQDTQMNQFIEAMERRMRQADSQEAIQGIRDDMLSTFNHLKGHKALIEGIKKVVEKQSGPDAKAHQTAILSAFGDVPLEERGNIGADAFNAFKTKAQELAQAMRDDGTESPNRVDKSGNPSQSKM